MKPVRRPHGPITTKFKLMWFNFKTGKVTTMPKTFEQYVAAIDALAFKDDQLELGETYCDAKAWRDAYDDGLTPEEAWAEEVSCFVE